MAIEKVYRCSYCDKTFKRKVWYDRHRCDKMKRYEERHTMSTKRALELYNYWNRKVFGRKKQYEMEAFCKSKYFTYFKNLSDFTLKHYVVNPFSYMDYLIAAKIEARFWCAQRNLVNFRELLTEIEDGVGQAEITIDNIRAWCQRNDCLPKEFFDKVTVSEVIDMVRECRLMPWPLLGNESSLERLISRFDDAQLDIFDELVDVEKWLKKTTDEPDAVQEMVNYMDRTL